jgi:hypothetical protein
MTQEQPFVNVNVSCLSYKQIIMCSKLGFWGDEPSGLGCRVSIILNLGHLKDVIVLSIALIEFLWWKMNRTLGKRIWIHLRNTI